MNDNTPLSKIKNLFVSYFTLGDYLVPQDEAEAAIRDGISFRGTNIITLILAILIASLGLNTNSTAVIIGAMLISPLMGPIIGIGLGVGIQDFELIKKCVRNLIMAALFSMLASTLYFLISPVSEGHSELLARTSPTIYDVLIGFFGGGAGIIALGSRSKGNVIPGVAIATALMPPLCTAGYGLATAQFNYFFGATYLFLINSIYIALATFIGVKLMNYRPHSDAVPQRARKVRRIVYTIAVLTLLPSIYLTYTMLKQTGFTMKASRFVSEECRFNGTQVLGSSAHYVDGRKVIDITLIGRILPADSLELALSNRLRFYGLAGTKLNIIQGDSPVRQLDNESLSASTTRDIYQLAQATITRQQTTVDSLRAVIAMRSEADSVSARLTPELKVLFPQVSGIAVTKAVFGVTSSARLDTVNVALVKYSSPLPAAQQLKFKEYLEARLGLKSVSIVNVGNALDISNKSKK